MRKLLTADFSRAFKSRVFWIAESLILLCSLFMIAMMLDASGEVTIYSGQLFFFVIAAPIVASALIPILIGKETANGALRNKLIVGHTKTSVYGSHLIVSAVLSLLLELGFFLPYLAAVLFTSDPDHDEWMFLLKTLPCALLIPIVFTALYVLVCMLSKNRSVSAAGCVLIAFLLLLAGAYFQGRLAEEEFISYASFSMFDENGNEISSGEIYGDDVGIYGDNEPQMKTEKVPNPRYLKGTKRNIYQFLYDFTPGGQAIQFSMVDADRLLQKSAYSALLFTVISGIGFLCFRKKNLE